MTMIVVAKTATMVSAILSDTDDYLTMVDIYNGVLIVRTSDDMIIHKQLQEHCQQVCEKNIIV